MMKIETKYQGEVELKEEETLHFPQGVFGFPEEKKFVVLPLTEDQSLFTLQSLKTTGLAFVITSPFQFFPTYEFDLEDHILEELKIKSQEEIQVFSILTIYDPFEKTTANLMAPVIINAKERVAKQVVLNNANYLTKQPLFQTAKVKG
ncbi:flagellar assembly protein FliW [Cytobacillus sp. FJAT-54145]|uniref:Flagellar assembly factor FliW n=1 Tax=Cytobacillus spartinae TaxID=3299023 RepID=A0ABW6KBN9_9BACI